MQFNDIIEVMLKTDSADIFIRANSKLRGRVHSLVKEIDNYTFTSEDMNQIIDEITPAHLKKELHEKRNCEFALWFRENWRLRVSAFFQRNTISIVIRKIDLHIPSFESLNLPGTVLEKFCTERRGLIFLTGITGSGKSTTIASMIEHINENYNKHILTIEEPIEFTYQDKKCLINQREIGKDVFSYEEALRQFALHSPDVIFIGNIRDEKTCYAALTAAEMGVLVFSTLHTVNAPSTVERIINFFPPHQHSFVLAQLSRLLKGVVCLRLIPRIANDGVIPAYEVMSLSPTIARLIKDNKLTEIPKYIASGDIYGMKRFDQSLVDLVEKKIIDSKIALEYADKKEELELLLRNRSLI